MRIGIMSGAGADPDPSLDGLLALAKKLDEDGFDSLWLANVFSLDAMTVAALAGASTQNIELGTAIVPSFSRHPVAMAQQTLTTHLACNGRFALGLGLSHKMVVEDMWGLSYAKPAAQMEEYLQVLGPLMKGEAAAFSGEFHRVNCQLDMPGFSRSPDLLVAALGPRMLEIAGRLSSGTTTWMVGEKTLQQHIVPSIQSAAEKAGCPPARVVAGLPLVVTDRVSELKADIDRELAIYGVLPSYRAMLDREGAAGPSDIALVGSEEELDRMLDRLEAAGVTDLNAAITTRDASEYERSLAFLKRRLN